MAEGPARGTFVLHANVKPTVLAGRYELAADVGGTPFEVAEERTHVTVSAPRFVMPPDQVLSTFPPANGEGAFGDKLPQVVLKRRTLPWERDPAGGDQPVDTPWLALVVVAEGEAELSPTVPVEQCVTPGTALRDPADRDVAQGVHLVATETVVRKVFPTRDELPLLVHVREVDVQDTELAGGDDDGWAAVVLANRLPVMDVALERPVRYLACLVNLEGQLDALPEPGDPDDRFGFALAQDWSVLATATEHLDVQLMGSGVPIEPRGSLRGGGATPDAGERAAGPVGGLGGGFPARLGAELDGTRRSVEAGPARAWATTTARIASAATGDDAGARVRGAMGAGFRLPIGAFAVERTLRFPVLAHWSFTTTDGATFETLMQELDVGLLGTLPPVPEPDPQAPPPPPPTRSPATVTETGHLALGHRTRRGDRVQAWYRGPLVPHPTERDAPAEDGRLPTAHSADQLRRVVPDGREDVSLASAFEIGRLLALSQLSVVSALLRFRREQFGVGRVHHLLEQVAPKDLVGTLDAVRDLSHLVSAGFVGTLTQDPEALAGPRRRIADPGRPLRFAPDEGLDEAVATGLGLDLDALRRSSEAVGVVAALGALDVPVAGGGKGPVRGDELEAVRSSLHDEVVRIAVQAVPELKDGRARPRAQRSGAGEAGDAGDAPARDALDDLLDRLEEDAT